MDRPVTAPDTYACTDRYISEIGCRASGQSLQLTSLQHMFSRGRMPTSTAWGWSSSRISCSTLHPVLLSRNIWVRRIIRLQFRSKKYSGIRMTVNPDETWSLLWLIKEKNKTKTRSQPKQQKVSRPVAVQALGLAAHRHGDSRVTLHVSPGATPRLLLTGPGRTLKGGLGDCSVCVPLSETCISGLSQALYLQRVHPFAKCFHKQNCNSSASITVLFPFCG